jgi:hypothetical protein
MIFDDNVINKNQSTLYQKCYICNLAGHFYNECPKIFFIADRERTLLQYHLTDGQ